LYGEIILRRTIPVLMMILLVVPVLSQTKIINLDDLRKRYPDLETYDEKGINLLGYRLIQAGKTHDAIEVFQLITVLYLDSWNAYDSLGEAYMISGYSELAVRNYSKSVQINPENTNGNRMLEKLRHPLTLKDTYSVKELREDFLQFRGLIEESHPCPYEFTEKESFDRSFRARYEKISAPMSLGEFYNLLAPLKAEIGCRHAHLDYPEEYRRTVQVFKFPLILRFPENRCFVIKDLHGDAHLPLYSEILSINDTGIDGIIDTLKSEISADGHNDFFKTSALETCFQYYYANHYGAPKEFKIEYIKEDSSDIQEVVIPAIPCSGINYSDKEPKDLDIRIVPGNKSAVLTIDSFSYYDEKNKIFFSFVDEAFSRIKKENIENVIIDLRGNGGGDPFCAVYLMSYIEKEPWPYFSEPYGKYAELSKPVEQADNHFTGEIFFLIDGSNFSTTGHFCSLFKYHGRGTFIGTETGSTYTCNAGTRVFPLKNTGISLKIANGSFAAAVDGFPKDRGIIPHHTVNAKPGDLKTGKDTVLDYALKLIDRKK
jgi:hypothetical protein